MSNPQEFHEKSYCSHSTHYLNHVSGGVMETTARTWLETDTVDFWRHNRLYGALDPILHSEPSSRWLTVGDGRYGGDARYILQNGGRAVATDISDLLLQEACTAGVIPEFSKQNAENLLFESGEFDYVLCKESFHHFPRPYIALYEMLRVASKGIVLIEPNDTSVPNDTIRYFSNSVIRSLVALVSKTNYGHTFEPSGNYVYTISKREIEKAAIGMNYASLATKGYNDYYLHGVEFEKISSNGNLFKKISTRIKLLDMFSRMGLLDYGMLAVIIFKQQPSAVLRANLEKNGYSVKDLPQNPYAV